MVLLLIYLSKISKTILVVEAHPDNQLPLLRLDQPFEELKNFCSSIDLNNMSEAEYAHIPYIVILYKYLDLWKIQVIYSKKIMLGVSF